MCSDKFAFKAVRCFSWPARRLGAVLVEESFTRREEFSEAQSRIAALMSASLVIVCTWIISRLRWVSIQKCVFSKSTQSDGAIKDIIIQINKKSNRRSRNQDVFVCVLCGNAPDLESSRQLR